MAHRLVDERQEDGLQREVAPGQVERRRPEQHAAVARRGARAAPARPPSNRASTCAPVDRLHGAVAVEPRRPRSRRCAARGTARTPGARTRARRHVPTSPRVRSTGWSSAAGSTSASCGHVARGPSATSSPPPLSTNRARRRPSAAGTVTSLSTTTDARRRSSSDTRLRLARRRLEARRVADGERTIEEQAGARASPVHQDDAQRLGRRDDEMERVVGGQAVGSDAHRAAHVARGHRERIEGDRRGAVAIDVERLRLDAPARQSRASPCRHSTPGSIG